jgi:hypothetical protein
MLRELASLSREDASFAAAAAESEFVPTRGGGPARRPRDLYHPDVPGAVELFGGGDGAFPSRALSAAADVMANLEKVCCIIYSYLFLCIAHFIYLFIGPAMRRFVTRAGYVFLCIVHMYYL